MRGFLYLLIIISFIVVSCKKEPQLISCDKKSLVDGMSFFVNDIDEIKDFFGKQSTINGSLDISTIRTVSSDKKNMITTCRVNVAYRIKNFSGKESRLSDIKKQIEVKEDTLIFNTVVEYKAKNHGKTKEDGKIIFYLKEPLLLNKYVGELKNGVPDGTGTFYYKNRDYYKGEWKAGKKNGAGKIVYFSRFKNQVLDGEWKEDKLIKP